MFIRVLGGTMKFKVNFFMILMLFNTIQAKDLIWDFGGIVFHPDKLGVGRAVGLQYFLLYMVMDLKNPNVQNDLFKFLETVMPADKKFGAVGAGDGQILPTIMRHWQAGTLLAPAIIKKTEDHIKKMDKIGYFESHYEKELIRRITRAMFDPKILAQNIYPIQAGVDLLKKCVAAKNADGTKKNNNYGGSNMDPLSFKISKKLYPEIFKLFDGIVISGDIGKVKPDKNFYQHLIKEFNLNPKNSVLIDDQEVNAIGARKCEIGTLILRDWDYKRLEQELKLCGAL